MMIGRSFRVLIAEVLGALRTRIELFSVEWQQARSRLAIFVGLLLAAVAFLWLAAMMFSIMAVTLAWNTPYRNWVVVGLLLFYLLAGLFSLWTLKKALENPENHPFSATIHELTQDARNLSEALDKETESRRSEAQQEEDK